MKAIKIKPRKGLPLVVFLEFSELEQLDETDRPEIFSEYEIPVPGIPTVVLVPFLLKFTVAPLPPTERLAPFFPRLTLKPGAIFTLLRNLNPITVS